MLLAELFKELFKIIAGDVGRLEADEEIFPLDSVWIFDCFSWHSLTDASRSTIRWRRESTVRLSTVSWFGWSFPTVSSMSWSSKRNITGSADDDLLRKKVNKMKYFISPPWITPVFLSKISIFIRRIHRLQGGINSLLNVNVFVRCQITKIRSLREQVFPVEKMTPSVI